MSDHDSALPPVPEANIRPRQRTRLSLVWIIPIVAAVAGGWIAATRILNQGPEITIVFSSADGLEAKKTKVNFNGMDVGLLTEIRYSDDHKHVIATAQMSPTARTFIVKDTEFWVEKPRINGLNISGLGTILSGNYIGMKLGQSTETEHHFIALDQPPFTSEVPGRFYILHTPELGSLGKGTPIYYRKLPAGQVVSYELDKGGQFLNVKIFVKEPYDQFIKADTRFWNASGVDVSLNASGLQVQTESLLSILAGGVAFETPAEAGTQPAAAEGAEYTLFDDRTAAFRPPPRDPQTYVLVFKQSVRGLTVGAPVQIGGVDVGEVTKINPQFDARSVEFSVPVTIVVDPLHYGVEFLHTPDGANLEEIRKKVMDTLVGRGLCAQLKSGNLVSGSLYVSLDFVPGLASPPLDWSQSPVKFPTVSGKLEAIEDSVAGLLKNVNQTVTDAGGTLSNANQVLGNAKALTDPNSVLVKSLNETLAGARGTLTNADALIGNAGSLLAPDSALMVQLDNLLKQGGGAAQALRVLADYLERHPEALIRGKTGEAK